MKQHEQTFRAWLEKEYRYPLRVARDMASRCRRVETSYGLRLSKACASSAALEKTLALMTGAPKRLLAPGAKSSAILAYRLAVKRYSQFLSATAPQ